MWGLQTVWWLLLSYWDLIKGLGNAGKRVISLTPVGKIKVMDVLTLPPASSSFSYPLFLLPPSWCWSIPALQVQISCCLLDVNRARHKSFDWLNFHFSTKGKNAFLLMINDSTSNKPSTYMGFISRGNFFFSIIQLPADTVIHHLTSDQRVYEFRLTSCAC